MPTSGKFTTARSSQAQPTKRRGRPPGTGTKTRTLRTTSIAKKARGRPSTASIARKARGPDRQPRTSAKTVVAKLNDIEQMLGKIWTEMTAGSPGTGTETIGTQVQKAA